MTEQKEKLLYYLYQYRFLTRNQIQALLHHKQFNRIIIWLNDLTKEKYIRRYYNPKTVTIPAIYSLGLKGRLYLKQNAQRLKINKTLLDRVWREPKASLQFRDHCQLVADIYLSLEKLSLTTGAILHFYPKTSLTGLQYLILPNPDAYFSLHEKDGLIKTYFLDIFNELPARMELRKRIKQYFHYFDEGLWQDHNNKPFPSIIFVCPDNRSFNYLDTQIQKQLENEPDISFFLTTREKIKTMGICRETLEKVIVKE